MTNESREALAKAAKIAGYGLVGAWPPGMDKEYFEALRKFEAAIDALARAPAVQVQGEWLPMSDAAKPLGRFLAVVDGCIRIVRWGKTSHVPMYGWILIDQGAEDAELCQPTHYRPMPELPKDTQ